MRILDPGVPASVMEDKITRQHGKDIDIALRDASTRLDRAILHTFTI